MVIKKEIFKFHFKEPCHLPQVKVMSIMLSAMTRPTVLGHGSSLLGPWFPLTERGRAVRKPSDSRDLDSGPESHVGSVHIHISTGYGMRGWLSRAKGFRMS